MRRRGGRGLPRAGHPLHGGRGACFRQGTVRCREDGAATECSAAAGLAAAESCNGLDDDCDGAADEDFPELWEPCSAGEGTCRRYGFLQCRADGLGTECNAVEVQPNPERCDGLDNDCDGEVDEDFAELLRPCFAGQGICARPGIQLCTADGQGTACDAEPGLPGEEICDGLDNDCNGSADDGFPGLGQPCSSGRGSCARMGVLRCTADGRASECSGVAAPPGNEVCNGLDDDCDGETDEGEAWRSKGQPCSVGLGSCARSGVFVCDAPR
ncbi:MAG: hypothetical protein FJ125_18175, partial [Deltaproteobacteria bacterium]|nr:hypothetical protein [Deltaproteobacteria bacterium]